MFKVWIYVYAISTKTSDCRSRGCKFNPARSHTFLEIDHEIISSHSPPSADSRRVVVSYK